MSCERANLLLAYVVNDDCRIFYVGFILWIVLVYFISIVFVYHRHCVILSVYYNISLNFSHQNLAMSVKRRHCAVFDMNYSHLFHVETEHLHLHRIVSICEHNQGVACIRRDVHVHSFQITLKCNSYRVRVWLLSFTHHGTQCHRLNISGNLYYY